MALRDAGLYTLTLKATDDPNVVELVEGTVGLKGETRYYRVKETVDGEAYSGALYDGISTAKLGSTGYVSNKLKSRRLQLYGPDETIPFDFTGKFSFEWTFTFENNKYRWKKSGRDFVCLMDRRPDPPVDMCLARQADSKAQGQIQILHYNIDRFEEIKDVRGLETLLVLTLADVIEERLNRHSSPPQVPTKSKSTSPSPVPAPAPASPPAPPTEEYEWEDENEVIVGLTTNLDEHISRAIGLLEDPNVLFIIIRTRNAQAAPRAMNVLHAVTRYRHRECLADLKQYVTEEEPKQRGPRVIKLDDTLSNTPWAPPNIAIYLSTIDLPDLIPKPSVKGKGRASGSSARQEEWRNQSQQQQQSRPQQLTKPRPQSSPPVPASVGQKEKEKEKRSRWFRMG